jgi:hypothetical protein
MPKSESQRMEALEAMLAERRKHEGYLAKLEERRAKTPEHVFSRLRDEYLTKLTDLQVRAAAEAEALATGIEQDEAAVAEIDERLATVQEERIEGELRAEVGEYDAKDWAKKLAVLNATISQLEKEREAKAGVYERMVALLDEARAGVSDSASGAAAAAAVESAVREGPSARPPQEPRPGPSAEPRSAPSARPSVETRAAIGDTSAAPPAKGADLAGSPSFDELAFLNSVVGRASSPVPIPPAAPVPRASRPVPVEQEPPTGASASPRAPTPRAPAQTVTPPAAAAPIPEPHSAPSAPPIPVPPSPAPAPDLEEHADEPPGPLGRPTPRTSQAVKTLKCQECGTLNYPTEWYCERCGGELAAL